MTAIATDWKWRRIPNALTYPTMLAGLGLSAFAGLGAFGTGGFLDHLAALVLAFALSYPFYASGGMKAGDAKFLMAVGAARGTLFLLPAALYGALVGGVIALGVIAVRRLTPRAAGEGARTIASSMRVWIPYGVALGIGALLALAVEVGR